MKNMKMDEFIDWCHNVGHEIEFSCNGTTYTLEIGDDSIGIDTEKNEKITYFEYRFNSSDSDKSVSIEKFLNEKLFDGKSIKDLDSEIYIEMVY